ncbi:MULTISPECIES: hypothetical protein [unclassified Mycobacterium]|uniref:hypothetical protein n=1 Tax=unclassified Mycobacterium TaxID=2642494 RepID=UPI0029C70902|nr:MULTISPECIES: hypothetical protein [unclassified Mycobacterium]
MADGRKRSAAKQARRDARRRKARREGAAEREALDEAPLIDEVRQALDTGQPLDLLVLVSMVVLATTPQPAMLRQPDEDDLATLDELVAAFIGVDVPETTALLAVLGEVLVDDDVLRDRCRRAVEARDETLPGWLAGLAQTSVHRAVRMTHVLGDGDELLFGVRLADGQELSCAANIDHLMMSVLTDAFFVPEPIEKVLTVAKASNTDPDTSFVDLDLADARAELQQALERHLTMYPLDESDTWPSCRPLLQWLIQLMPEGGSTALVLQQDSTQIAELLERFFGSLVGMPFNDIDHRKLLEHCAEEGTGNPLRWSALRLRQLLDAAFDYDDVPAEVQLDLTEMLRAFVPFAHAQSGIREELTAEDLVAIDEVAGDYRAMVLEDEGPG